MLLDMFHQALPADWPPLTAARTSPLVANALVRVTRALAGDEDAPQELVPHARALLARSPQVRALRVAGGLRWDLLRYLLADEPRGRSLVFGHEALGPHAISEQGQPLMWTAPARAAELAAWTRAWNLDKVMRRFVPGQMEAAGGDKFVAGRNDDGRSDWLRGALRELAALHDFAAHDGLGVLVVRW